MIPRPELEPVVAVELACLNTVVLARRRATSGFPFKRVVMRSCDVSFTVNLIKLFNEKIELLVVWDIMMVISRLCNDTKTKQSVKKPRARIRCTCVISSGKFLQQPLWSEAVRLLIISSVYLARLSEFDRVRPEQNGWHFEDIYKYISW